MPSLTRKAKTALADRVVQHVIVTRQFRMGQTAARRDFAIDPDATPNAELGVRLGAEFWAGYVDEWENFLAPTRARTAVDW